MANDRFWNNPERRKEIQEGQELINEHKDILTRVNNKIREYTTKLDQQSFLNLPAGKKLLEKIKKCKTLLQETNDMIDTLNNRVNTLANPTPRTS